jgi:hypothetical protein
MFARRPLIEVVACFAMGSAMGLIPWLFRHRFYLHDDMQHQHMPIFVHIGRLLRAGEAPILSLATFTAVICSANTSFAVLNPFSLLLYSVLPSIRSLETGALFLACAYYGVLASGMYVLARAYRVGTPGAVVAAIVIVTNNLISTGSRRAGSRCSCRWPGSSGPGHFWPGPGAQGRIGCLRSFSPT